MADMYVQQTNEAKYERAAAHPEAAQRIAKRMTSQADGCMVWTGAKNGHGYGTITVDKQAVYVHRLAYWLANGPVDPGMVIDHMCRNRACVNVDHLRILTPQANNRLTARSAMTHCRAEHPLSGGNLQVILDRDGRGHRQCRECNKNRSAEWRNQRSEGS